MPDVVDESRLLEIKGRMLMVTVLKLASLAPNTVQKQLAQQLEGSNWLREVPLVIQVTAQDTDVTEALPGIIDILRDMQLSLIGLNGPQITDMLSTFLGLPIIELGAGKGRRIEQSKTKAVSKPGKIIDQPVRSGQQIYSNGDLIITSTVGNGAEVMAEGNIHIYGNLRGRALAGVQGNTNARIFCQRLNAELVSIGGHYRVAEGLPEDRINQAVAISLQDETMQFSSLT